MNADQALRRTHPQTIRSTPCIQNNIKSREQAGGTLQSLISPTLEKRPCFLNSSESASDTGHCKKHPMDGPATNQVILCIAIEGIALWHPTTEVWFLEG